MLFTHLALTWHALRIGPTHYLEITNKHLRLYTLRKKWGRYRTTARLVRRNTAPLYNRMVIHQSAAIRQLLDQHIPARHRTRSAIIISIPPTPTPQLITTQLLAILHPLNLSAYTITTDRLFLTAATRHWQRTINQTNCLLAPLDPTPLKKAAKIASRWKKRFLLMIGLAFAGSVAYWHIEHALAARLTTLATLSRQLPTTSSPNNTPLCPQLLPFIKLLLPSEVAMTKLVRNKTIAITLQSSQPDNLISAVGLLTQAWRPTAVTGTQPRFKLNSPPLYEQTITIASPNQPNLHDL